MKDMARDYASSCVDTSKLVRDRTALVEGDRVLATKIGMIQKRAQCCEELSPCPHATQGERSRPRSSHESGIEKDPRMDSAIGHQWDVSGIPPSLNTVKGGRIYIVIVTAFFAGWGKAEPEWIQAGVYST